MHQAMMPIKNTARRVLAPRVSLAYAEPSPFMGLAMLIVIGMAAVQE